MDRKLVFILLLLPVCAYAQIMQQVVNTGAPSTRVSPIVADGSACAATSSSTASLSCGNITVTTGDLVWCDWWIDNSPSQGTFAGVSDSTNGQYTVPQFTNGNTSLNMESQGQAYFLNAGSGTYAPHVALGTAGFASITCQPFKHVLTTNALDSGAINQLKLQTGSTAANPTSGTTQTPSNPSELITCVLGTASNTPTVGAGYTLLSGAAANLNWGEYEIQTSATATNCPFTMSADKWVDGSAAFLPTGATGGITPLSGAFVDMGGLTNAVAPTTTTMAASSYGINATSSSAWAVTNTHTDLTGTTGNLCNLASSIFINGSNLTGSESSLNLTFTTGTGGDQVSLTPAGNGNYPSISTAYCMETNLPTADSSSNRYSLGQIANTTNSGTNECDPQIVPTGSALTIKLEISGGASSPAGSISISRNTLYQVQMQYTTTSCSLAVYNSSGTQVGSTLSTTGLTLLGGQVLTLGTSGGESQSAGSTIQFANWQISYLGTFPLPLL